MEDRAGSYGHSRQLEEVFPQGWGRRKSANCNSLVKRRLGMAFAPEEKDRCFAGSSW